MSLAKFTCSLPIRLLALCPMMDLVAFVHIDETITIRRTQTWEVIFNVSPSDGYGTGVSVDCQVECIAWSPDGKGLALALKKCLIFIFDIETGEVRVVCNKKNASFDFDTISLLKFFHQQISNEIVLDQTKNFAKDCPSQPTDRQDNAEIFFGELAYTAPSNMESSFSGLSKPGLNTSKSKLSFLFWGTTKGCLSASIHGVFTTVELLLPVKILKGPFIPSDICCSYDLSSFIVCTSDARTSSDKGSLSVNIFDSSILLRCSAALNVLAKHYTACSTLLDQLSATVAELSQRWKEAVRVPNAKINQLRTLLRDRYESPTTPRHEFLRVAAFGQPSPAMAQFLSQNLNETNVTRMTKATDATLQHMEGLLRDRLLPVARVIFFRAGEIRGSALAEGVFKEAGLEDGLAKQFLDAAEFFALQVERVLREVYVMRDRLSIFLAWLLILVAQATGTEESPGRPKATANPKLTREVLSFLKLPRAEKESGDEIELILGTSVLEMLGSRCSDSGECKDALSTSVLDWVLAPELNPLFCRSINDQAEKLSSSFAALFEQPKLTLTSKITHLRTLDLFAESFLLDSTLHFRPSFESKSGCFAPDVNTTQSFLHCYCLSKNSTHSQSIYLVKIPARVVDDNCTVLVCNRQFSEQEELIHACFYGGMSGVPFKNKEQLGVLTKDVSGALMFSLEDYDSWNFIPVNFLGAYDKQSLLDKVCQLKPEMHISAKSRQIVLDSSAGLPIIMDVVVTRGFLGVACIVVGGNRVGVLDLEADDDESGSKESSENG